MDIAVPADGRVQEKEREKKEYQDLRREIGKLWQLRKVQVFLWLRVPGEVRLKYSKSWMEKLRIPVEVGATQNNFGIVRCEIELTLMLLVLLPSQIVSVHNHQ